MTNRPPSKAGLVVDEIGEGAPVVLLHSSGLSGRQFRRLATTLAARGFRAIVPDLHGHGQSPVLAEPQPFSFERDVSWLRAQLKEREPAYLVGHSYGAFVALQAALNADVRGLVLFEPVAFGVLDPALHADALAELARGAPAWGTSEAEHVVWLRAFVDYWGGTGAWEGQRPDARAEFHRVGWAVREGVRSLMDDRTAASVYAQITAPVTILRGERSTRAARDVVAVLGASLPRATVVDVPNAGHMGPLTHGELVNTLVESALSAMVA